MLADRLRQVRLARGFSLEALAATMGGIVTKQALSKYERGKSVPSHRVLHKLAAALQAKASYLWSEPSVEVVFYAFRKRARLSRTEQERIKSIVCQELEQRVRLQELIQPEDGINIPVESLAVCTTEDIERAAEKCREEWELGIDPVANVTDVLEAHSVHVLEVDADERFDGLSAVVHGRDQQRQPRAAGVVARRGLPRDRQRLSLLHELAHLLLKILPPLDAEKAAYRFAGAFLAPASMIRREIGEKRSFLQPGELLLWKERLGMSIQALLYRLRDLDVITQSHYREWCVHINRLGWRKQEPQERSPERPAWLYRTVLRALSEDVITRQEAQDMLGEDIEGEEPISLVTRRNFMKLPIDERRRILARQAEKLQHHYDEDSTWRELGGGDVVEHDE